VGFATSLKIRLSSLRGGGEPWGQAVVSFWGTGEEVSQSRPPLPAPRGISERAEDVPGITEGRTGWRRQEVGRRQSRDGWGSLRDLSRAPPPGQRYVPYPHRRENGGPQR